MASFPLFTFSSYFLHLLLLLSLFVFSDAGGRVGINYGRVANNLPSPEKVVELIKSQGLTRVKLYDTDESVLTALANSGLNVVVALPNEFLSSAASDRSFTDNWVRNNIYRFHPSTRIEAIAVGNEVFVDPTNKTPFLVPAMKNVRKSLVRFNLSSIKVSTPIALSCLSNSYPASSGSFKRELAGSVMKPMLKFLRKTGSYLMVNVYPFFAYSANSDKIPLNYALFEENPGVTDPANGLKYYSLLEAQIDAVFAAMSALGYHDVKMVVTETGWPSKGDENEIGAGAANAASYNGNLVKRVLTGNGTPLRPKDPLNVFLFALFNENQKPGPTSERNYGLFYPNERKVYDMPFSRVRPNAADKRKPANGEVRKVAAVEAVVGHSWCVANGKAGAEKLQAGLDYACGEGGADCRPIQEGATCYHPNTVEAHASYAFNSYYQQKGRGVGTCDFGGAAYVVTQPPRFGKCYFPTGY